MKMGKFELELSDAFHRKLKAMSASKGMFLKDYLHKCLEDQLWRDSKK